MNVIVDYKDLFKCIREQEFPNNEQLWAGVPIDWGYWYVSTTYLNGLVNYGERDSRVMFYLKRYRWDENSYDNKKWYEDFKRRCSELESEPHSNWGDWRDDVILCFKVISKEAESYVMMWFDKDCSDSAVIRWDSRHFSSYEGFVNLVEEWFKHHDWSDIHGIEKFPGQPSGWLRG